MISINRGTKEERKKERNDKETTKKNDKNNKRQKLQFFFAEMQIFKLNKHHMERIVG